MINQRTIFLCLASPCVVLLVSLRYTM